METFMRDRENFLASQKDHSVVISTPNDLSNWLPKVTEVPIKVGQLPELQVNVGEVGRVFET